ncbi:Uncharacterised protein [Streptococcus pneumoniae]|uniref:hypothetical protein n=1 Tax=Bacilli TaxID=91061 RepID=UPI0005E308A9|nr:hypothetical protein [Bacillus paranthracis]CKE55045.1 Uncharacterised protein [Streptococcus pneumoniae]CKE89597.1 Uncharacterised protein [Streptococcus pneumoniae]CKF03139.1 Uncharacterised protein [Bacillus paranthracis]CKF10741.1 Uncharacterised protein [Streptococcus pneumoniae]CKF13813.1 Uncharacterised protein [Streptococcus pneumoniae]
MKNYIDSNSFAKLLGIKKSTFFYRLQHNKIPQPTHIIGKKMIWDKNNLISFFEEEHECFITQLKECDKHGI